MDPNARCGHYPAKYRAAHRLRRFDRQSDERCIFAAIKENNMNEDSCLLKEKGLKKYKYPFPATENYDGCIGVRPINVVTTSLSTTRYRKASNSRFHVDIADSDNGQVHTA